MPDNEFSLTRRLKIEPPKEGDVVMHAGPLFQPVCKTKTWTGADESDKHENRSCYPWGSSL